MVLYIVLFLVVLALCYILFNFLRIRRMREGTDVMVEMAGIIRSGATAFLETEFKTIAIVVVVLAAIFSLFIEATSGITFLFGACMSSAVCVLGMRSATYANVRTANVARETRSIGETVKVALCGGSISGLSVQAFGMLGMVIILLVWGVDPSAEGHGLVTSMACNPSVMRISTYSLGCSVVAMFNRVAGGNYTKAADISSDILAKLRHDLPEDDSRVPNVIADFIGDNAKWLKENDNCSLLYADAELLGVTPPMFIEVEVTETDPGFKGDTVQGGTKPATIETGAVIQVPMYLSAGERIKVDTRDGKFVGRV